MFIRDKGRSYCQKSNIFHTLRIGAHIREDYNYPDNQLLVIVGLNYTLLPERIGEIKYGK